MKHRVVFRSSIQTKDGKTVLDAAKELNIDISAPCKGKGKCGKCVVKIIKGKTNEATKKELKELDNKMLEKGYRLACQVLVTDDLVVKPV